MTQQTAMQEMRSRLQTLSEKYTNAGLLAALAIANELIGKEKQQIIDAWRNGDNDSMYSPEQLDEQAKQYYNETYNK